MATEEPLVQAFRCQRCGAPLDVTPETIIAICKYCGYPNVLTTNLPEEEAFSIRVVPTLPEKTIIEKAMERTRRDPDLKGIADKIRWRKPYGLYIPFYTATISLDLEYWMRLRVRYVENVRRGNRWETRTYSRILDVSGKVSLKDEKIPILARKGVHGFSVRAMGLHYINKHPDSVSLQDIDWKKHGLNTLSAEFSRSDAEDIALEVGLNRLKAKAYEEAVSRARGWRGRVVNVNVLMRRYRLDIKKLSIEPLTLVPYWRLTYEYRGGIYRYYMSGWDGEVVIAEEPVLPKHRIAYLLGGIGGGGLSSIGAVMAAMAQTHTMTFLGAFFFVAGALLSYTMGKKILATVRVESPYGGGESMEEEVEKIFEKAETLFDMVSSGPIIAGGEI
ncbi:MAG: hypothetical protein GXO43_09400 [Crenarchaeota archaeon]|nr:hypothetical protein [Thermoproteota archaeon]